MFIERLRRAWAERNSLVCVGLDPEMDRIPEHIRRLPNPIFEFNRRIIDATAEFACAFKPQIAHYAAVGAEDELGMTLEHIRARHPGVLTILDAKRGDIGSTARMYAVEAFDRYGADAVTVNPYLGGDSLAPFLERSDRGVILLCRTSNPGARDLQDLDVGGRPLYQQVARLAAERWNGAGNVMLVVGATYPKELAEVRALVGDMPFLVPGVGAQGGDVAAVMKNGRDARGTGVVVSSSRAILYANSGKDFETAAAKAAKTLRDDINNQR